MIVCTKCGDYVRFVPSTVKPLCGQCYLKKKANDRRLKAERNKMLKKKVGRPVGVKND